MKTCLSDCSDYRKGYYYKSTSPYYYTVCKDGKRANYDDLNLTKPYLTGASSDVTYEDCDDGSNANIGCLADCTIDPLWTCTDDTNMKSICIPKCGDGVLDSPLEVCDDLNRVNFDGCNDIC